jgi:hypothetical protein
MVRTSCSFLCLHHINAYWWWCCWCTYILYVFSRSLSICLSVCPSVRPSIYLSICLSVCLSVCLWLYSPLLDLGGFVSFLIFYTVGRTPWTGDQPVGRPLRAHRTAQTENKRIQTSMLQVGFEPTIPMFERAKKVHALDTFGHCDRSRSLHLPLFLSLPALPQIRMAKIESRTCPSGLLILSAILISSSLSQSAISDLSFSQRWLWIVQSSGLYAP